MCCCATNRNAIGGATTHVAWVQPYEDHIHIIQIHFSINIH